MKLKDLVPAALIPAGEDDAIELLTADHDKVQELFEDFEEIKESRANKEKDRIVAEACRELTIHTTLEEEIFYPAVRAAVGEADMMNEAQVEHDGAKELISQLEASDASDDMFSAKFTVLIENVRHHIKEEQDEMFPKARKSDLMNEAQVEHDGAKELISQLEASDASDDMFS